MFSVFTVCFFGHRVIDNFRLVEDEVESVIADVVNKHEFVEFLIGREGDFDQIVTSAVLRYKKTHDTSCALTWVMPYMKADYLRNQDNYDSYYDSIEICEQSAQAHPKAAIQIRNRAMIDRSDLCVFYVTKKTGGAYQSFKYAEKNGARVINLAETE